MEKNNKNINNIKIINYKNNYIIYQVINLISFDL